MYFWGRAGVECQAIHSAETTGKGMSDEKHEEQVGPEDQEAQPLRIEEAADDVSRVPRRRSGDADDEDETWTNQPTRGSEDDLESEDLADEPE